MMLKWSTLVTSGLAEFALIESLNRFVWSKSFMHIGTPGCAYNKVMFCITVLFCLTYIKSFYTYEISRVWRLVQFWLANPFPSIANPPLPTSKPKTTSTKTTTKTTKICVGFKESVGNTRLWCAVWASRRILSNLFSCKQQFWKWPRLSDPFDFWVHSTLGAIRPSKNRIVGGFTI